MRFLLCLALLAISITACRTPQATTTSLSYFPTSTIPKQAVSPETDIPEIQPATPTAILTPQPLFFPSPTTSSTSTATIPPDPMHLVYPTEGSLPATSWRPPLYPTPWAPTLYDHFYFTSPFAANEPNAPVSDYRYGGIFFENTVHTGVDIPAPTGTPILTAGPGTVIWAGYGVYQGGYDPSDPYGLAVTIRHDFGYQNQALYTIYGHMSQIDVVEGQHVETGDQLGLVGETGKVTGPHLHFEVRLGENDFFATRNPELWLVPPMGWGLIAGRVMDGYGQLLYDQQIIITDPATQVNLFAWSYGKTAVNSDSYYQENLVIGDLPAGSYVLRTAFGGANFKMPIQVRPGVVNYFTFRGYWGFTIESPPAPGAEFTPAPIETTIP